MGKFTKIPQKTFDEIQMDAGILLKDFDPENPDFLDTDIICATTGGISATCVPTFSDFGEDIDNCPANMMELMHADGWETTLSFTAINISEDMLKLSLGVADTDPLTGKVTPRRDLSQSDFTSSIWFVGDRTDGGFVAIHLMNVLSTGGFSLQTTKNGKGQLSVTLSGHVSISAQDTVPMEFYVSAAESEGEEMEEMSEPTA